MNAVPEVTQARNKTGPKSSATFLFLLCQQLSQVATDDSGVVPRGSMSAFLKCAGSQAVGGSRGWFFFPVMLSVFGVSGLYFQNQKSPDFGF